MFDGDDYWCDVSKIQNAVRFLEEERDYNLYTTKCIYLSKDGKEVESTKSQNIDLVAGGGWIYRLIIIYILMYQQESLEIFLTLVK